ncbi:MAG: ZIP family metal transporter [Hespellia sp.]|nr:ZIP family metal transporter [Hespellia sp.]
MEILIGILIPFAGTTAGAACVLFMRGVMRPLVQKVLLGFASGIMVAASVWSLLIPAIDMGEEMGKLAFFPAAFGFVLGILFLLLLDLLIPHLHVNSSRPEGIKNSLSKTTMLLLAVTLHNIPEGMAVGVAFAGMLSENSTLTMAGAFTLSVGIAIQNFPEGAIISMPLSSEGMSKRKALLMGALSGIVEPIGAGITVLLASFVEPLLPYFLSFAAGAMLYVVVEELIPEASDGEHSNIGTIGFAVGFLIMMVLDVALG